MLIGIDGDLFDSLDDEALFLAVVKPIGTLMHSGNSAQHKYDVYRELTPGQRDAFMFWVLYSHARDLAQFYTWVPYMRQPQPGYWQQLVHGMAQMGCEAFLPFLEACEAEFARLEKDKPNWTDFSASDLDAPPLKARMEQLYQDFEQLTPSTIEHIGRYIRQNKSEFEQTS